MKMIGTGMSWRVPPGHRTGEEPDDAASLRLDPELLDYRPPFLGVGFVLIGNQSGPRIGGQEGASRFWALNDYRSRRRSVYSRPFFRTQLAILGEKAIKLRSRYRSSVSHDLKTR
jgi:hypothetical protein